jgi:hypothetical protein
VCRNTIPSAQPVETMQPLLEPEPGTLAWAEQKIQRLTKGWLRVIQQENSCPATGGGCLAKRCGCVEEMEMLANEQG